MSETAEVRFGPFRLMGRHGPLLRDDREIRLQRKTVAVLWMLASHPGAVVTRTMLMDAVWPGVVVGDEALTYQIQILRRAIEDDPREPRYIVTVHRVGFRLMAAEAGASAQVASMFGRSMELQALSAALQRAEGGRRQFMFIGGEAGIGKTTLLDAYISRLRAESPATRIFRGQCLEVTGESEAYQSLLDALDQGVRGAHGEQLLEHLRRNAPSWLLQMPRLLAPEELEHLRRITAGMPPGRQHRELAEALEALSVDHPLVLVIEDLHWSDASTVALLGLLAQRDEPARLLVICSCRHAETIVRQHPARALQLGLMARGLAQSLHLEPLNPEASRQFIQAHLLAANEGLTEEILRRSGGHPLFLVHLAEYLRSLDLEAAAAPTLDESVPPQLRELIELQLLQLTDSEQLLLEVGAIAGQEFSAAVVAAGTGIAVEVVEEALETLARHRLFIADRGLAIWPDGTASGCFHFRHALYGQVLRKRAGQSRAARIHRRVAERLEGAYQGRQAEIATELAHHFEAGGVAAKAAAYCIQTAQNALGRLAPHEVREQVARGLALLAPLTPDQLRHRTELRLRIVASHCLQIERGYLVTAGDDQRDRIDELIELVGDDPARIPAVEVQWLSRHFNMEYARAITLAERLRDFGRAAKLQSLECAGLGWAAHSMNCLAQHEAADRSAAEAYRLALKGDQSSSVDPRVLLSAIASYPLTRWYLGFPEQALALADQVCGIAERQGNPYERCMITVTSRGLILAFIGDQARLMPVASDMLELGRRCGHLESQRWAGMLLGIAQFRSGDPEAGLRTLLAVLDEMRQLGLVIQVPLGLVHVARAWSMLGEHARALEAAEQALQLIRQRGHLPWEPEVLRTMGELHQAAGPRAVAAAMEPIREALELARTRKALSLELRAANSLARLHRDQGRLREAVELLEPILARFTEGLDMPDQREARSLIASMH